MYRNSSNILGIWYITSSLPRYGFSVPVSVPWAELDLDHVISAGQVFSQEEAQHDKAEKGPI